MGALKKGDRVKVKEAYWKNYPNWQEMIKGVFVVDGYGNNMANEQEVNCWVEDGDRSLYILFESHLILMTS